MKKHALGFLFFASIVSVFALGYAVFRTYSIPAEIEVSDNFEVPARKTSCFPKLRNSEVRVIQAIADLSDRTLVLDLSMAGVSSRRAESEITFSFYRVDTNGARLIRSDERFIEPVETSRANSHSVVRYKLDWLGNGEKLDNLYVMARAIRSEDYERGMDVPFSRENATPIVLIAK